MAPIRTFSVSSLFPAGENMHAQMNWVRFFKKRILVFFCDIKKRKEY
jgi:hypothetical protein